MILSNFRIIFFQFRSFRKIPMLVRILIFNGTESYWNMKKILYSSQKNVKNKVTAIVVIIFLSYFKKFERYILTSTQVKYGNNVCYVISYFNEFKIRLLKTILKDDIRAYAFYIA